MILKVFVLTLLLSVSFAETYLLVHGATIGAWSWFKVKTRLEKQGHTVITFDLPSLGVDKTPIESVQLHDHVDAVLARLDAAPEPVILVGHSYGGVLVSLAADARPAKVKKAVYIAAIMLQDGESPFGALQSDVDSLALPNAITITNDQGAPMGFILKSEAIREVFCEDCCEEDIVLIQSLSQVQAASTFLTPISLGSGFSQVSKAYISTLKDKDVTPKAQKAMYSKFPETEVRKIQSSHMVLLSKPKKLVDILTSLA